MQYKRIYLKYFIPVDNNLVGLGCIWWPDTDTDVIDVTYTGEYVEIHDDGIVVHMPIYEVNGVKIELRHIHTVSYRKMLEDVCDTLNGYMQMG